MSEYLDKFRTTAGELEAIGAPLEQEGKIATLLNNLPQYYDNLVITLESRGDQISVEFVNVRLLQEEMTREKISEEDDSLFLAKTETKSAKNVEEVNLTKSGKRILSKEEMRKVTCYYFNKKGHCVNKCFTRIAKKKKNEEEAIQTQMESEYLFSTSIEHHKDESWYLDSGAMMHMTYKRNLFKNYAKIRQPRLVKMGEHSIQKGVGMGDIHMKLKHGKVGILSNVLHVHGLKKNLQSISKISDLGFFVNLIKDQCKIFNKQMKQIVVGIKVGRLYSLNESTSKDETSFNIGTSTKNEETYQETFNPYYRSHLVFELSTHSI